MKPLSLQNTLSKQPVILSGGQATTNFLQRTRLDQANDMDSVPRRGIARRVAAVRTGGAHGPALVNKNSPAHFTWAADPGKVLRLRLGGILGVKGADVLASAQDDGTFVRNLLVRFRITLATPGLIS